MSGDQQPPSDQPPATPADQFTTQAPQAWSYSAERQRFTILRFHRQGGLGRLSIARDGELNREIALKEILPAQADDQQNRRRFLREAEITGALEHPGVVPVYSLGEFADGRPFYAMRLIRGDDLRAAIDNCHSDSASPAEKRLEFRQLLGRFVDVCQTIDYAHHRGVVHRDLKPSNIMLGDYGETLVVDWGLARTLDGRDESLDFEAPPIDPSDRATPERTQAGRIVGTLQYMSPEQALGRADLLAPASDIYGLGATLYHMLCGRPPFDADEDTTFRVQQGRFARPRTVAKGVPRPLEAVCLKAMARRPEDRYATARELALDVERYLGDERVHAYAEPLAARLWRWIRHHRTPVMSLMAAAIVAVAALSIGLALLKVQRDRAERNFQLAQAAVRDYFVRVSEETLLDQPGMQPLRDSLLRQALAYYERFLAERQDDPQLRREAAEAQYFVGRITETIDSPAKAIAHFEQAAQMQRRLIERSGSDGRASLEAEYARTINALAGAMQKLQRLDEARRYFQEAAVLREQLAERRPEDGELARGLASSLMNLGVVDLMSGNPADAMPRLERAQSLRLARVQTDEPTPATLRRDLGMGYYNLALAHLAAGDLPAAAANFRSAIMAFEQLAAETPGDLDNRRRLALCHRMLADLQASAGEAESAIESYEQARDALVELVLHNPNVPGYATDLAGVRMNLGSQLDAGGDADGALAEMLAAVELLNALAENAAATPRQRGDLGVALRAAGELLTKLDRPEEARERFEHSRAVLQSLVREHPGEQKYAADLKLTEDALAELDAI